MSRDRLPVPEVVDGCALEDGDKLTDDPPQERDGTHFIQCPAEPDLRRQLGGMLGEDTGVEEEDRTFDHGDRRGVEVFEHIEDVIPLLRRVGASHCLVLAEIEVGRCPIDQPLRTETSSELGLDPPMKFKTGSIQASGIATRMA